MKQNKVTFNHGKIVNIYIVYELILNNPNSNYPTLENCLFRAVKLTRDSGINNYKYLGYRIGFDRKSSFLFPGGGFGQNVIIFGVDMSSSAPTDNNRKDILVLGKGLEYKLTAEKMYSINFTVIRKKFSLSLSLHYDEANSCLFVNSTEIYKFKVKYSEIVATSLCLGNITE